MFVSIHISSISRLYVVKCICIGLNALTEFKEPRGLPQDKQDRVGTGNWESKSCFASRSILSSRKLSNHECFQNVLRNVNLISILFWNSMLFKNKLLGKSNSITFSGSTYIFINMWTGSLEKLSILNHEEHYLVPGNQTEILKSKKRTVTTNIFFHS